MAEYGGKYGGAGRNGREKGRDSQGRGRNQMIAKPKATPYDAKYLTPIWLTLYRFPYSVPRNFPEYRTRGYATSRI